ncbi:MAG: hydrogenase nickel incorporation protein HypB [Tetrasphaera sp.]
MGRFHIHNDGTTHLHDGGSTSHHDGTAQVHEDRQPTTAGDHSAYRTGGQRISVLQDILGENARAAAANRAALDAAGVTCVNLMSSPGAGKTTLLATTLRTLREKGIRAGVVEGDIETSLDADRLAADAAQVALVNTSAGFGGECHLDAPMVARGLSGLDLAALDLVLIENVGNLVCPAEFDTGAHHRVMISAVTEGEDKPLKYPVMFRSVELVLVNKIDLLPHLDLDVDLFEGNLRRVNPDARVLQLSARTGDGVRAWLDWLTGVVPARRARPGVTRGR